MVEGCESYAYNNEGKAEDDASLAWFPSNLFVVIFLLDCLADCDFRNRK